MLAGSWESEGPESSRCEFDLLPSPNFGGASDKISCREGLLLITSELMSRRTILTCSYWERKKSIQTTNKRTSHQEEEEKKYNLLEEEKGGQERGKN